MMRLVYLMLVLMPTVYLLRKMPTKVFRPLLVQDLLELLELLVLLRLLVREN